MRCLRNWWRHDGDLFRGLQLKKHQYLGVRLMLVYAIDCEQMDDPDYQELVLRAPICIQLIYEIIS